jgi:uncharacterized protein involved in outer membrane biogenesis
MNARRILIVGAVVVVVAGAAAAVVLREFLDPERLRAHVVRATSDATGLEVSLAEARLTFVPLAVSLRELRVGDAADPFLEMESGLARLEIGALLRRSLTVDEIVLERPRVRLRADSTGVRLPGRLGEPAPAAGTAERGGPPAAALPAAGFRGAVRSFVIEDGSLHLSDAAGGPDTAVEGIDLRGSLEAETGGRAVRSAGTLSLQGLSLAALDAYRETLDRLHPVVDFRLEARPPEGVVEVQELRLRAEPLDLSVHGRIAGLPEAPALELVLEPTSLDLAELLPLLPPGTFPPDAAPTASGPVRIAATVSGPLGPAPPAVTWSAALDGATFGTAQDPQLLRDLRGEVTGDARSATIAGLRATLGDGGSLAAEGTLDALDSPDSLAYDLTLRGESDLALADRLRLLPEGVRVSGRAALDVRAQARGAAPPQLEGTVTLREAGASAPDLPVPAEGWNGSARFTGQDLQLESLDGRLGRSDFHVTGRVENLLEPRVTLTGRSSRLDLVELAPPPSAGPGGGTGPDAGPGGASPGSGPAGGVAASLPPLVPPFPPFPLTAELKVDSLFTQGASMAGVTLRASGRDGSGTVDATVQGADYGGVLLRDFRTNLRLEGQTATGTFQAPAVQAFHVPMTEVRGDVSLGADRVLRLTDMTAAAWSGAVQGTAEIDLRDPVSPAFDIRTDAKGLQANDFVSSLTPADGLVFGAVDVTSSFQGRGATPEEITRALTGSGTFSAHDGHFAKTPTIDAIWKTLNLGEQQTVPFRDLLAAFAVRDGSLVTDGLTLQGGNAAWKAAGSVSFTGELSYDVQVELNDQLSDLYRKRLGSDLAGLFAGSQGRLVLDLKVRGNASRPTVQLDKERLAARAAERAKQQVGESLKGGLQQGLQKLLGGSAKPPPAPADSARGGG